MWIALLPYLVLIKIEEFPVNEMGLKRVMYERKLMTTRVTIVIMSNNINGSMMIIMIITRVTGAR